MFDWKAIANLLNAAALTINFIVTVVSWPLIMPYILLGENYSIWSKIDQSLIHALPLVFSLINTFFLSDAVVYYSDSWLILALAAFYLFVTYYYTYRSGRYVYYFLTWEEGDWMSLIFSVCTVSLSLISHNFFAFLTQLISGRSEFESEWWE